MCYQTLRISYCPNPALSSKLPHFAAMYVHCGVSQFGVKFVLEWEPEYDDP